jgi:outer membrane lipoprotein-sorting protein
MLLVFPVISVITFNTLSLNFERQVIENNSNEITKGTIYYESDKNTIIDVNYPLHQIMIISKNIMIIYYPEQKKAFRFITKNPLPPIFVHSILMSLKDDFGLTEMDFKLSDNEIRNDTLYTYWDPPEIAKKILGKYIIGIENDKLVYVEIKNSKNKVIAKSYYSNHIPIGEKFIALKIYSESFNNSQIFKEYISYSDVKFNIKFPDYISNFKIPEEISIKDIEW